MKYALVTGGSRGIGREISLKIAAMGYSVLVNYVANQTEAEKTQKLIHQAGGAAELIRFDVADRQAVESALEQWRTDNPDSYIEVLVNNAGIRKDNLTLWMEPEEWDTVIDISLTGFFNVTRLLLKDMCVKKHGRIINIASVSGIHGVAGQANYSAAKGGLIAATRTLALEVARKGVTVNAVAPGFIETDMVEGLDISELKKQIPMRRLGQPNEVADLVAFLASSLAAYITGETISINGGLFT